MVAAVIAAVAGAIGGGVMRGVTTAIQNKKLVNAYKDAAKQVREATEKYSGENLYNAMRQAGDEMAYNYGRNSERAVANQFGPNETNNQFGMATNLANQAAENSLAASQQGRQTGMNQMQANANAKYNAETVAAQQAMKQAGIDYNVANQATQAALEGVGGLADVANQTISKSRK